MTLSIKNNGDGTLSADFEYTAAQQRVMDTLDAAARQLWLLGYGPSDPATGAQVDYDNLTNQQRLDMIDARVLQGVQQLAKQWYIKSELDAAEVQILADADTKYI